MINSGRRADIEYRTRNDEVREDRERKKDYGRLIEWGGVFRGSILVQRRCA